MNSDLRILLVEDDEDDYVLTLDLLRETLGSNVEIEWVDQFDNALLGMMHNEFDIYLLDYRLGAEDGLALLREAIRSGCRRPIILLTGQGDHDIDLEAMRAGAADYLVKGELTGPLLERSIRYAIQQKKTEEELFELQQRLAESRESERLHLAQELHDGPLQALIGARFHLGVVANTIDNQEANAQLKGVQDNLQTVVRSLRRLCRELRPPALAPFGLEQAIRAHASEFQKAYPEISLNLDLDEDRQLLEERVRLALYRIYQHALTNVVNHAEASNVRVSFRINDEVVNLRIIDDGRGFTVPKRWIEFARLGHLGLVGSVERAEAIGGHFHVRSTPDTGTVISVIVPL